MLHLVFIAFFLLGAVVGWLVVYFVRKYKDYTPRVLRDAALMFLVKHFYALMYLQGLSTIAQWTYRWRVIWQVGEGIGFDTKNVGRDY